MRATRILGLDDVREMRAAASRFAPGDRRRKLGLLRQAADSEIIAADVLIAWHDCLLFLLAYPDSRALHRAAGAELRRVAGIARTIVDGGPARERRRLEGSGLAFSPSTFAFGWEIARWLGERFPRNAEIDSFGDEGIPLAQVLSAALPPLEFSLAAGEDGSLELLDAARGGRSRLAWLAAQLERLRCDDSVRALLFDALGAYLALRPQATTLSRTFVRGLPARPFIHTDGIARRIDVASILARRLPRARSLDAAARTTAIDAARAMLACLGRETDPIALAYPQGVEWHDTDRGIAIALYAPRPDRRDALDSHIGMMIFKNGLPVGYGGGWPFAGTCRIGVNVFEPYRGGESMLLFAEVLRVYRQRFGVVRFIVEPTQFGGANIEGLRSGAFWFYYRLGFRPIDPRAAARADELHARMQADRAFRPSLQALRRVTDSDLELRFGSGRDRNPLCEPAQLSAAVTAWIDGRFGGDRDAAEHAAVRRVAAALRIPGLDAWSEIERRAFVILAPLLVQIPGLARWPATDRRDLAALIRAKGGDEYRFQRRLLRHRRLRHALAVLASRHA